ncbi:uncharacterized protein [Littorina saxatilis]|uniref:BPTI/Kunitz inhibitor domain-containing protein n=1 Tax=Littorina saxatilis TaxID=31220 RepID=A0AAN9ASE3_9CAEN
MKMIVTNLSSYWFVLLGVLLLGAIVTKVNSAKFSYGREAEKLCQAYKKICPRGKVCAIQTLRWPRVMKFPVCVHEHTVQVKSKLCEQAPSPGGCGAQFRRWYYNVHMADCSWFTYGGCGGNDNNFRSREECEKVCVSGPQEHRSAGTSTIHDVTHRPNDDMYPRHHVSRHHHSPHHSRPSPERHTSTESYDNRRHHSNSHNNNRRYGYAIDPNQNTPYASSRTDYDRYGKANVHTTASPTTKSSWRENFDEIRVDNHKSTGDSNRPALEYRKAPVEHHRIPTRPEELRTTYTRPEDNRRVYVPPRPIHHNHGSRSRPAALHTRPSTHRVAGTRNVDNDWSTSFAENNRPMTEISENSRRLTGISGNSRRLPDASENSRRLTDSSDTNRHIVDLPLPDKADFQRTKDRLSKLAYQVHKPPTINIQRRISNRRQPSTRRQPPSNRQPVRSLSLLSRPHRLAAYPRRPLSMSGVTSGLTSPLQSSYAAEGNETIRSFPKRRRQKKKGKGRKRKTRRRRKGKKNRRRGRKNRQKHKKNDVNGSMTIYDPKSNITDVAESSYNTTGDTDNNQALKDLSGKFVEFRKQKTSFWPASRNSQNDEGNQQWQIDTQTFQSKMATEEEQRKKERRRERRRRRRRKGKGKRKHRGKKEGMEEREVFTNFDESRENSTQPVNQYYEKIHLFGLVDTAQNATDPMTS